jgi:hypothetical protein
MTITQRWTLLGSALFFALICSCATVSAQMKGWEVGGMIGASNYFGDLNTNWRVNRIHLAGTAAARYNFNDRLSMRMGLSVGQVSATDTDSKNIYELRRNLSFKSMVFDATAQLEFNFMPYVHGHRDYYYTPYMFVGPSLYRFNPRAELNGTWYDLVDFGTEGQYTGEEYNTVQGGIAYGMGFKYDLSYHWSFNVEFSTRKLFSDYLDDVSGTYADPRDIRALKGDIAVQLADRSSEPRIGLQGRQRGNGRNNDMYMFLTVGVMYYFGHIRCPQMRD